MAGTTYSTLARVKVHMEVGGADPVDSSNATYLLTLLNAYSEDFDRYLGRKRLVAYRRETLDVEPGQRIFQIKAFPNISVTTITADTSREWTTGVVPSTDYHLDSESGILMIDKYAVAAGYGALRITYTGGMATNTTAFVRDYPDLATACELQVVHHYRRRDQLGSVGHSQAGGSISWLGPMEWLPTVRSALDRHRTVSFG